MKDKHPMTPIGPVNNQLSGKLVSGQQALLTAAKRTQAETPFLLIDLSRIKANCRQLQRLFPKIGIYYAMKANSAAPILAAVHETGVGFEVASPEELQQALSITQNIDPIISSHPVKPPRFIAELAQYGCNYFVFDTKWELDKIAKCAPRGSRVVLRLAVDNKGAEVSLSGKFGAIPEDAIELMLQAKNCGLSPYGLTFHVGSQCRDVSSWEKALQRCHDIIDKWLKFGTLKLINMGGGFPEQDRKPSPSIKVIAQVVNKATQKYLDDSIQLMVEPGRFILNGSGILVASVIGGGQRGNKKWLHIDAGIYSGLIQTIDKILDYEIVFDVDSTRHFKEYAITGPTCDSDDTPFANYMAPDLEIGERVYILNANSYTTVLASSFNGFPPAQPIFIEGPA